MKLKGNENENHHHPKCVQGTELEIKWESEPYGTKNEIENRNANREDLGDRRVNERRWGRMKTRVRSNRRTR